MLGADGTIKALERRAAGLLALVALEPGITRARAAALLWPESDTARQALRQQIARFRKNYGADLVAGADVLVIAEGVVVDALQDGGGALLGELAFDDCEDFADWLAQQRAQRRSGAASGLVQQIAAAEAGGDLEAAARLAEQLLLADNDSEAHHRTLMRLHYLRGDIAQAQAAYERLVRLLRTRFGARPSVETEQLARALRAAQPAARAVAAAPSPLRPVPVTVLRPPRMIGRQRELGALVDAWQSGRAALLLGEPGLGKTRLLAEFGAGRRVLMVQGRPGDAGVPYATLSRLLRAVFERTRIELPAPRRTELARLLPELAPSVPLPADGQRLLLQGAVEAVLAQARADGTASDGVIVDDLHFADDASV
ncbi:MAG: AAA family ATPase, partial [Burkholderiaceae bacterium]|nr:AAA family ATPase [Burkholderiaceae bacterium]